MSDFKSKKTNELENRALLFLSSLGFNIIKNNKENITATDFIYYKKQDIKQINPIFIDFQYSCDFKKYGDLRIDYVSAYTYKKNYNLKDKYKIEGYIKHFNFTQKDHPIAFLNNWLNIKKSGKLFNTKNKDTPESLIYFIFNDKEDNEIINKTPDLIYIVNRKEIIHYLYKNIKNIINNGNLKLNNKSRLGDNFGSAFICVPLKELLNLNLGYIIEPQKIINKIESNITKTNKNKPKF